jgi:folate-dependent phosphoribosylglycinamide formyltransferase PurN
MLIKTPLRVAVLCSHRAPGLLDLVERDPTVGRSHEIVAVITSEFSFDGQTRLAAHGVPTRAHSIHEFYRRRDADLYRDFGTRAAYDGETVGLLARYAPDIVLLDGYLYIATPHLLDAYPNRILNLHFSDLTLRHADGRPCYPGIRAVRDALADGRTTTKATVHAVNREPDGGVPLVESWPFPVAPLVRQALAWGARDMFKAYAFAHQEWMIRAASGPLLSATLRLIADGTLDLQRLGAADPAAVAPWSVDSYGHVTYRYAA